MEKKPIILLIDDERNFLDIFSTKLNAVGFDVYGVQSGADALQALKEIRPDLILLDFSMPDMDGVETLSKIKADPANANVKIAFLTNYGEPLPVKELAETDKRFAQEMGAKDYLRKSDDLDEIVKKVWKILKNN